MFGIPDLETFDQVFTDSSLSRGQQMRYLLSKMHCPWNPGFDIDEIPGEEIIKILRDAVKGSKLKFWMRITVYINVKAFIVMIVARIMQHNGSCSINLEYLNSKNQVLKLKTLKNLFKKIHFDAVCDTFEILIW